MTMGRLKSTIWSPMKRTVFLIVVVLFVFLTTVKVPSLYAQETVVKTDTPVGIDTLATPSSDMTVERVNYELPYPGMLPDNPFYFLKVIRDGIVKMLINNPLKKAQFSLLNAEKRMYAGKMLHDKGNDQLAIDTIGKSNNYLFDAIQAIRSVKSKTPKNTDIRPFLEQFKTAASKHLEMMEDMKQSIDKNLQDQFLVEEKRIKNSKVTVEQLLKQR